MIIQKAIEFATKAHGNQKRKYTNEPYIVHCLDVGKLVASVTEDNNTIVAAILHDVVEDTQTSLKDIEVVFGPVVAQLVNEVTDIAKPEDGNREIRKAMELLHLAKASPQGKTIKLADLINNSQTIAEFDPKFAKVYMREKKELLFVLQGGHPLLWSQAKDIVDNYFATT